MASIESKLFYGLLRLINKKKFLDMQFAFGKFDFYNSKEPPREVHKVCHVRKHQVLGRNVFTLTPLSNKSTTQILYLHGGAYVQGFVRQHWTFLAMLVKKTHCTIVAPDYPLAPLHTYKDSFAMVSHLYISMIEGSDPGKIILMGDSAGGGFALAFAQKLYFDQMRQPEKIILLCPWLDITLKNPEVGKVDLLDPFLSAKSLRKAGKAYAGDSDPDDYMLSPLNGPLKPLGEISIFIGTYDLLVADTRKIYALALQSGTSMNYREYKDMVHMWMLLNFPESMQARNEIIELIL